MAVTIDGVRYSWDQPICDTDWERLEGPRVAYRIKEPHVRTERCSWCGEDTRSGIYKRAHPNDVPFPALEVDGE